MMDSDPKNSDTDVIKSSADNHSSREIIKKDDPQFDNAVLVDDKILTEQHNKDAGVLTSADEEATGHIPCSSVTSPLVNSPIEDEHKITSKESTVEENLNDLINTENVRKQNDFCGSGIGADMLSLTKDLNNCDNNESKNAQVSELPSVGILVEDGASFCTKASSKSTNEGIKKMTARLNLEHQDVIDSSLVSNKCDDSINATDKIFSDSNQFAPDTVSSIEANANDTINGDSKQVDASSSTKTNAIVESDVCGVGTRRKSLSLSPMSQGLLSPSDVEHKVKRIKFQGKELPIVTQNNNGPCPLIAIINALILKGEVELGVSEPAVSGGLLVSVVANALIDFTQPGSSTPQLINNVHRNTDDAVQVLHKLLTGLDVNVKFSGVQDFEFTNELCVFDGVRLNLYHGWVVDPEWASAEVVQNSSYNQLTNNIITWHHQADAESNDLLRIKALLCEDFLEKTSSQLTVHGLFLLGSSMQDGEVAVFFRNNHFSTIYKYKEQLYQLLTDQGFLTETAAWQTLSDVDSSFTEFVTEKFEPLPRCSDQYALTVEQQISNDEELAAMLQSESDKMCQAEQNFSEMLHQHEWHSGLSDEELAHKLQEEEMRAAQEAQERSGSSSRAASTPESPAGAWDGRQHEGRPVRLPPKKKKDFCCIA